MKRVVLLTGNGLRHRFAASRLAHSLNIVGIVSEAKGPLVNVSEVSTVEQQTIIERHFAERDEVERRMMGEVNTFPDTEVLTVLSGNSNSLETYAWIQRLNPDVVLLYGTSIIRPPLLNAYEGRLINLHLGLSPYYRGSGTNFWALVHRQPECVGATIHLAVLKVDAGAVLGQVRPEPEPFDRAHELGTKTIISALEAMPRLIERYFSGDIIPQLQDLTLGRVFKKQDFNADAVTTLWHHLDTGMVPEYLDAITYRQLSYPIVQIPN